MAGQLIQLNKDGHQRGSILLPGALALCGVALVSILQITPRRTDRDVTAIFAHDISFDEAAARVNNAGAAVLRGGPTGNIIVARLTNSADTQSLQALREAGAWLILSADTQNLCSAAPLNGSGKPNNATNS